MSKQKFSEFNEDAFLDDPEAVEPEEAEDPSEAEVEADEMEALRAENAEMKDRMLRALADVENIRKRGERDRRDAELYASTRFARDLLSVHDNFDRALESVTEELRASSPGLIEGIELTQRDLLSVFEKHKITRLEPAQGEKFDPKLHQAMFEAPLPGTKAGEIIQVMNVGFMIGERLLRPAQVGVSSGGPDAPAPEPTEET
ncbi:MAG: nucleotide exchange factor GrpE [Pseudomonadota bacterium]